MSQTVSHIAVLSTPTLLHAKNFTRAKSASRALTTVLVVEYRDEVFARVEADLAAWGIEGQRATGAEEARRLYYRRPPELVLAHSDLPDETGWLFACKLRIAWPSARLWVYTPRWTAKELVLAEFIGVEEVIAYGGDLQRLAAEVFERLVASSLPLPPTFTSANGYEDHRLD